MAKLTNEEIIEALKEMTLLEASELVKAIEETFGVSAAAPAAVVAGPAAAAPAEEEKTEFDVVLEGFGDNKIQVIKVVRELTSLGLKEAKEVVESRARGCQEGGRRRCQGEARGRRRCRLPQVSLGRRSACSDMPHDRLQPMCCTTGFEIRLGPRFFALAFLLLRLRFVSQIEVLDSAISWVRSGKIQGLNRSAWRAIGAARASIAPQASIHARRATVRGRHMRGSLGICLRFPVHFMCRVTMLCEVISRRMPAMSPEPGTLKGTHQ